MPFHDGVDLGGALGDPACRLTGRGGEEGAAVPSAIRMRAAIRNGEPLRLRSAPIRMKRGAVSSRAIGKWTTSGWSPCQLGIGWKCDHGSLLGSGRATPSRCQLTFSYLLAGVKLEGQRSKSTLAVVYPQTGQTYHDRALRIPSMPFKAAVYNFACSISAFLA